MIYFTIDELRVIMKALNSNKHRIMNRVRRYGLKCASGEQSELDTVIYRMRLQNIEELDALMEKIQEHLASEE